MIDGALLQRLAPDVAGRDVYVCGPTGFMTQVLAAAAEAGVPAGQRHHESFDA